MTASVPNAKSSRRTRLWLFAPATLLSLVLLASAGGWLWARGTLVSEMDARAGAMQRAGWTVSWSERTLSGFPFRLKVQLAGVTLKAPGEHGWGLQAPALEAQAYVAIPTHWVFLAPSGLTILRPLGGPLAVTGSALRASTAGMTRSPWRIVLEGVDVAFATPPDARPFSFTSMKRFEFDLKPADETGGDAAVFLQVEGARAHPDSVVTRIAGDAPVSLAANGRLTRLSAARGGGWGDAVRAWSAAGGALQIERVAGAGGRVKIDAVGGTLGVGADGHLEGAIPLKLQQSEAPLPGASAPSPATAAAAQAEAQSLAADAPLVFQGGEMRLGPLVVGPAPVVR